MGQIIGKKIIPSNLSKAINSFESKMAKDALDDIAQKKSRARVIGAKYSDPNALEGGFKRDGWAEGKGEELAQESRQRDFLNDVSKGDGDSKAHEEMPKDLLDFLNAAGPLERKVDKSMTSPKIYESLLDKEEEEAQKQQQAQQRTRRRMLMVEHQQQQYDMSNKEGGEMKRGVTDDLESESEEIKEGLTTTRTTSFSTASPNEEEDLWKLTDIEIFQFLAQVGHNDTSHKEYLKRKLVIATDDDEGKRKEGAHMDEEEMQKNLIWLENICKYNGIPVLLQDTDKSLVGTWAHNVKDLEKQKLYLAENDAQLAIQNEIESLSVDRRGTFKKLE